MLSYGEHVSPVLVLLKPNLILCKCVGVCSLSNLFGNSHTSSLKCSVFSVGTIYRLAFVLYYELTYPLGLLALFYEHKFHIITLLSIFMLVMFTENIFSDKKLLKLLQSIDELDSQMKEVVPREYKAIAYLDTYKWMVGVLIFDVFFYFDRECNWQLEHCFTRNHFLALFYHHLPYLSVVSLFYTTTSEMVKRFQQLQIIVRKSQQKLNEHLFIEECRHFHALLLNSSELFLDWISFRITNHFMMTTTYTVCFICFPCFDDKGCFISSVAWRVFQQMVLVTIMSYSASKLNEMSEEILSELQMIPVGKCLYNCKDQIEIFVDQIIASPFKVTALGLFDVDMTSLPGVFSVILMYTVVVAQLADRLEVYFVLP